MNVYENLCIYIYTYVLDINIHIYSVFFIPTSHLIPQPSFFGFFFMVWSVLTVCNLRRSKVSLIPPRSTAPFSWVLDLATTFKWTSLEWLSVHSLPGQTICAKGLEARRSAQCAAHQGPFAAVCEHARQRSAKPFLLPATLVTLLLFQPAIFCACVVFAHARAAPKGRLQTHTRGGATRLDTHTQGRRQGTRTVCVLGLPPGATWHVNSQTYLYKYIHIYTWCQKHE